jgi:hypothetical protein
MSMPNITREQVEERGHDLARQLAAARKQIADGEATAHAIDGAIQENRYYLKLIAEQEQAQAALNA